MKYYLIIAKDNNPHYNLALEEEMLDSLPKDACLFYLWQNDKTVVIGKNQEANNECEYQKLEKAGGFLARRSSGGGAVYHDLGNLNFTFIMPKNMFSKERQLNVIVKALKKFGVNAQISGRNDILVNNFKFSGNAFLMRQNHGLHHGTILVNSDFSAMQQYLKSNPYKLSKRNITSVVSRVINLSELALINIEALKHELIMAFKEEYDCSLEELVNHQASQRYLDKYQSTDFIYGVDNKYTYSVEFLVNNEYYKLCFNTKDRKINQIKIYSDSLAEDLITSLESSLLGISIDYEVLTACLVDLIKDNFQEVAKAIISEVNR